MSRLNKDEVQLACMKGCGMAGSELTLNMCMDCFLSHYRDVDAKVIDWTSKTEVIEEQELQIVTTEVQILEIAVPVDMLKETPPKAAKQSRCKQCRKRVGIMGFQCKCTSTFCAFHRFPETHQCPVDYQKLGRMQLSRENPVVKGVKVEKI